ncbi:MAG: helix-turn-helix domain-containing protein [Bdellovibrionales bacterium]
MPVPKISFSTTGLPHDKIAPLWSRVLDHVKVGGQAAPERENDIFGSVDGCIFGTTPLNFWIVDGIQYNRTRQDCARNPNTDYSFFYIRSGSAEIRQRNRITKVHSGDCLFVDLAEPCFLTSTSLLRFTSLHIASELIKSLIPSPQNMTATVLPKQSAWVSALTATMHALTPEVVKLPFYTQKDLFAHICCLLSLSVQRDEPIIKNDKALMLNLFRQSIHERFYKSGLSPRDVAEEHKVSTRTLHSVFANTKSSFGRELLSIRMNRACHILRDPRFDNKTIAEVGFLVGFPNPSHFTTRFTKAHGVTPSAYRAQQQTNYRKDYIVK